MPRFPAARAILTDAIADHAFPGAAYGAFLRGQVVAVEAAGRFTYEPDAGLMLPETIFDIASVSKVLATTAMAMLLWERGLLDLDAPVGERLPAFIWECPPDSLKRAVTARMLLAHCSGLPAYERLFERCHTAPELLEACLRMPLEAQPGTRTVYSDIGFIVLGQLLEAIAGERLNDFCSREVFAPLGMESTTYCPPIALWPSIPPTAIDHVFRKSVVQGRVQDENCFVLGGVSGHAGVFSTAPDILRFARCILRAGAPILRPATIAVFTAPQTTFLDPHGGQRALGWDVPTEPSSSGHFFSKHSVGHLGYTGTSLWIDLEKDLAVVLLTNRTYPGDGPEGVSKKIKSVRPRFHDAVLGELGLGMAGEHPFNKARNKG